MKKREVKINKNEANFFLNKKRHGRGLNEECDEGCDYEERREVYEEREEVHEEKIEEVKENKSGNNWWR